MSCNGEKILKQIQAAIQKNPKISSEQLQSLFDVNKYPELLKDNSPSAIATKNLMETFYLSFEQKEQGKKPFIDVSKDLNSKLSATIDFISDLDKKEEIVRNGLVSILPKSAERVINTSAEHSTSLKNNKTFENGLAPVRNIKRALGYGTVIALGQQALEYFEEGDYKNGINSLAQGAAIATTSSKIVTEYLAKQIVKNEVIKKGVEEYGQFVAEKGAIRIAGKSIPIVGFFIEEGFAVLAIAKDGLIDGNWNKAIGNALVAQGGAIGALIPIPAASFAASELLSEGIATWYNDGKSKCDQVRGSTVATLWSHYFPSSATPPIKTIDEYLEEQRVAKSDSFDMYKVKPKIMPSKDNLTLKENGFLNSVTNSLHGDKDLENIIKDLKTAFQKTSSDDNILKSSELARKLTLKGVDVSGFSRW